MSIISNLGLQSQAAADEQKFGFPPGMLTAQVDKEGGVNPDGTPRTNDSSGAFGLAQGLPSTFAKPGYGVQPITMDQAADPSQALDFMAQYDAGRIKAAGGNIDAGLYDYSHGAYTATSLGVPGGNQQMGSFAYNTTNDPSNGTSGVSGNLSSNTAPGGSSPDQITSQIPGSFAGNVDANMGDNPAYGGVPTSFVSNSAQTNAGAYGATVQSSTDFSGAPVQGFTSGSEVGSQPITGALGSSDINPITGLPPASISGSQNSAGVNYVPLTVYNGDAPTGGTPTGGTDASSYAAGTLGGADLSGAASTLGTVGSLLGGSSGSGTAGIVAGVENWFSDIFVRGAVILLGCILVAAGLFYFSKGGSVTPMGALKNVTRVPFGGKYSRGKS